MRRCIEADRARAMVGCCWPEHRHSAYGNSNGVSGGGNLGEQQAVRCRLLGALGHG